MFRVWSRQAGRRNFMAIHDPIADVITVIRNGVRAGLTAVNVKRSRMTLSILEILKKERFIYGFKTLEETTHGEVRVYLQDPRKRGAAQIRRIRTIQRVSRPGLRIYSKCDQVPNVLNGMGVCVVSTSRGVLEGREAKRQRLGGEILIRIW